MILEKEKTKLRNSKLLLSRKKNLEVLIRFIQILVLLSVIDSILLIALELQSLRHEFFDILTKFIFGTLGAIFFKKFNLRLGKAFPNSLRNLLNFQILNNEEVKGDLLELRNGFKNKGMNNFNIILKMVLMKIQILILSIPRYFFNGVKSNKTVQNE